MEGNQICTKFVWTIAMLGLVLMPKVALRGGTKPNPICATMAAFSCGKDHDVKPCKTREAQARAALAQEAARQADAGRAGKAPSADDKAKIAQLERILPRSRRSALP
jgi:hypothetical protein